MKNVLLFIFLLFIVSSNAYTQQDKMQSQADFEEYFINSDTKKHDYEKFSDRHSSYKINVNNQDIPINTNSGQAPDAHQIAVIKNVIVDDFLVNDDKIGGDIHDYSSVAMDGSGNFVIVWHDLRNGNWDIYFQRYNSSGIAIGLNTKANDDSGIWEQGYSSIAMDDFGNFVIVWEDGRNGNSNIYFQRYNSSGTVQGVNTRANDDTGTANQYLPVIAMNSLGNFVIAWEDRRDGNLDIYHQIYNSNGTLNGVNKKVNDDTGTKDQKEASIAMDGNGNFVIGWQDFRNDNDDIYFQQYDFTGTKIGVNKKANDDTGTADQWHPSIAMDGSGNFVLVWQDYRNGNWDVHFQRYNSNGTSQGGNKKANDDITTVDQFKPSITINKNGNFVIAWQDGRTGTESIYYQQYNINGTAMGVNKKANDKDEFSSSPSIAIDISGNFVIAWKDYRNSLVDIYYQRYNNSGTAQGVNKKSNDDSLSASQYSPSIAMNESGNFVIAWADYRNGNGDIYYQQYNNNGTLKGVNTKVNDDAGIADQITPSITMNNAGNFVITWEDNRSGVSNIYFQRYSSNGIAQGPNTIVTDNAGLIYQHNPSIAMDNSGNFGIAWEDRRNGNMDIFYQHYNSIGIPLGVNLKANDDNGITVQFNPVITMDDNGNCVIVWYDKRNGNFDIYFMQYINYISHGVNAKVNDDTGTVIQHSPSVAMNDIGNFVITWYDYRNANYDIYFQRYKNSGAAQGVNTKANNDGGTTRQISPSVAMDNSGNFVIVWQDYIYNNNNPDIIGQRFYADGSMNEGNYRIVADGPNYGEGSPVVTANENKVVFTWMDNRRSKGWDIYGKIVGWDWDGVTSVTENELGSIKEFELVNNFPNPFYDITSFEYMIGNKSNIEVAVFDINGKKIRTILKGSQDTGRHTLTWDGKDDNGNEADKGVYFTRFSSAKFQSIVKTVLLK